MIGLCSGIMFFLLLLVRALEAKAKEVTNEVIDLQIRLAWAHASPGPIDGSMGMNTRTAIQAFQRMRGLDETGELNEQTPQALGSFDGKPTVIDYEITKEDVIGPFVEKIPNDMVEMTKLNRLSYTSPGRARGGGGGSERSRG
jgi:peptidoglycan hydrolase-like protein with peptidoglycan-binding domain